MKRLWIRSDVTLKDGKSTWYSIERPVGKDDDGVSAKDRIAAILESNKRPLGYKPDHSQVGYYG